LNKRIFLFFLLIVVCTLSNAQNTAILSILRNPTVEFIFKSFTDISSGKTLGNGSIGHTKFQVYIEHTDNPTTWYLDVMSNSASLIADFGTPDLDLNEITMDVYLDGVLQVNNQILTQIDQTIVSLTEDCTAGVTHEVTITYHCAESGDLMGRYSDIFYTDLIFNLHN
jgi:hypothetical protein